MAIGRARLNEEIQRIRNTKREVMRRQGNLNRTSGKSKLTKIALNELSDNLGEIVQFLEVEVAAIGRWEASVKTVRVTLRLLTAEQIREINEFQEEFISQLDYLSAAAEPFTILQQG